MARLTQGDRYAVLRGTGDPSIEGRWCDLDRLPQDQPVKDSPAVRWGPTVTFEPSQPPRYERREDGQSARVYVPSVGAGP